jgi:excisionase family DNA binding protein
MRGVVMDFKVSLKVTCSKEKLDDFITTLLLISKGYGIDVIESSFSPVKEHAEVIQIKPPDFEPSSKRLLTVAEVAKLLCISNYTLYTYTYQSKIPYIKVGSRTLFREKEVYDWIEEREIRPSKKRK